MDNSEFDREVSDIIIFSGFGFDGYGDGHYYGDLDGDGSGAGYGNSAGGLDECSMVYLRPDEYGVGSGYGNYHNGNGPFI